MWKFSIANNTIRTEFVWVVEFCSVLFKRIKYKMANIFLVCIIHFLLFLFCFNVFAPDLGEFLLTVKRMVKNNKFQP